MRSENSLSVPAAL